MSIMYLAKINLTSGIFDVYDSKLRIDDVLKLIYDELDEQKKYSSTSNSKYRDSMGNVKKFRQASTYQLKELEKSDDFLITGKMVRNFIKPTERIADSGRLEPTYNEENVSIYFYFDVKNELIAFSERQSFGYNQFTTAFNFLLNQNSRGYRFEIFLQKDNAVLQEKIKNLKSVQTIKATLIPPNSNEEDLIEFRNSLQYIQDCKNTNANKMRVEMSVDNCESSLKMESKYMQDIFKAVSRGYGDITTYGTNQAGRKQIVSSNQDAAYTKVVDENLGKYEYNEEARSFIIGFVGKLIRGIVHD